MVFDKAEANVIHNKIKNHHQIRCRISPNPVIRKDPGLNRDRLKITTTGQSNKLPVNVCSWKYHPADGGTENAGILYCYT